MAVLLLRFTPVPSNPFALRPSPAAENIVGVFICIVISRTWLPQRCVSQRGADHRRFGEGGKVQEGLGNYSLKGCLNQEASGLACFIDTAR